MSYLILLSISVKGFIVSDFIHVSELIWYGVEAQQSMGKDKRNRHGKNNVKSTVALSLFLSAWLNRPCSQQQQKKNRIVTNRMGYTDGKQRSETTNSHSPY